MKLAHDHEDSKFTLPAWCGISKPNNANTKEK